MTIHRGGCHCRNITVEYESDVPPVETQPRACQCSFCRQHQSRAISDPKGRLTIQVERADALSRYQFSLRSIEFLVCRDCGVYVAGFMPDPDDTHAYGTLMLSALDERAGYPEPTAREYDDESREARADRRRRVWTPATLTSGQ